MNLQGLEKLLVAGGIDISLYSKGEAKSLEKLLHEINDPEEGVGLQCSEDGSLLRVAKLMNIHVLYQHEKDLLRLREVMQIFNDGRIRVRNRQAAIAEKCHVKELWIRAVERALKEEIGVARLHTNDEVMQLSSDVVKQESQSYPGLMSEYQIDYYLYNMVEEYFRPEGYVEVQKDKKTYFAWEKV